MASVAPSPYSYFDSIVCINLKHRADRRAHASAVFDRLGLSPRVSFFVTSKSPLGGRYGCFESHVRVLSEAYRSGKRNVLVFEDDIYPTASYSEAMVQRGVDFMRRGGVTWDIFYLGYFPANDIPQTLFTASRAEGHEHVFRFRPNATHAYCMNRSGMEKVLSTYREYIGKTHIDDFFSNSTMNLSSFCMAPMLFEQMLCMPHDNESFRITHTVLRNMSCFLERHRVCYRTSWLVWAMHANRVAIQAALVALLVCCVVIALALLPSRKPGSKKT